ncbi:UPF0489 family protein, partial [candidate division KSB1 bacterium]|nr:UPF0489 family protein [candidate division KSB1 bacterium]
MIDMPRHKMKPIPVFCFDEHHEAYYYWHRARLEAYITGPTDLIHVDAHHDMAKPADFSVSLYAGDAALASNPDFYRRFAASQLTIADFILPAVLSGVVRNVYFTYPKWRKFKPSRKRLTICSLFGEGKILKYGIKVKATDNPLLFKSVPDLTRFQYFTGTVQGLPQNRRIILDIDLDYFACRDSITNHLSFELEITRAQYNEKDLFLSNKTLPFSGLDIEFIERENRFFAQIKRKKMPEISHLPSKEEIEHEIDTLISVLTEKKIRPAVVTICRSCNSGYCPS